MKHLCAKNTNTYAQDPVHECSLEISKQVIRPFTINFIRINRHFFILVVMVSFSLSLFAQDNEKVTPRLDFSVLKTTEGNRLLTANLYITKNRINIPLALSPVLFHLGTQKIEIQTNKNGIAYLVIANGNKIEKNENGFMKFGASFAGNDSVESIIEEKEVKDLFLNLSLEEIDSVRTVTVTVNTLNEKGDTIPLSGETVNLYVPRMINPLKIAEETTDDLGTISIEFPNDLPGSPDSTITVIAKVEEHEMYANVEFKKIARWGIPIIHRIPESHRALWTEIAPVWMIITLTVMLAGVWGHYIFVIIQLILIKLESKKQKV